MAVITMKGVVFDGTGKVQYKIDLPKPVIEVPTDAIVRVTHAGLCGSDLHPYSGREAGLALGTVMGHEFYGEIAAVGSAVSDAGVLCVGDKVCAPFTTCCGECFYCAENLPSRCERGQLFGWRNEADNKGLHGAQAEYIRVPLATSTLYKLSEKISPQSALLVGDILSTGFFCASRADIPNKETDLNSEAIVVIVGMGPVGMLALLSAFKKGALPGRTFAIDCVPERLSKAKEIGAIPINFKEDSPQKVIMQHVGRLADSVLECVGSGPSLSTAFQLVRPGGTLSSIGVATDATLPFAPASCYDKNITLRFGRCPARFYMPIVADILLNDSQFAEHVSGIVSHTMPLSQASEAYEMFANKTHKCTKVVFEM